MIKIRPRRVRRQIANTQTVELDQAMTGLAVLSFVFSWLSLLAVSIGLPVLFVMHLFGDDTMKRWIEFMTKNWQGVLLLLFAMFTPLLAARIPSLTSLKALGMEANWEKQEANPRRPL